MSREQAVSEVLARIDAAGLSDRRRLEVPEGWAMRKARAGWRRDAVDMRIKALRVVLHPDKNPLPTGACTPQRRAGTRLRCELASLMFERTIRSARPRRPPRVRVDLRRARRALR